MTDQTPPPDDDLAPDEPAPEPPTRGRRPGQVGRLVRIGCIALGVLGALGIALGASTASNPEDARCTQARSILEDDGDVEDADEIECDDAVAQALTLGEEDDEASSLSSESTIRTFGLVLAGIGVVQLLGAMLTMRTRAKGPRLLALIGTGIGIVFSPLGLIGVPLFGFVVYAIFFSADARAVFGEPGGPKLFRPRPPRTTP